MSKDGSWGDNVTLQAAANYCETYIYVVTHKNYLIRVEPNINSENMDDIWIAYTSGHYNGTESASNNDGKHDDDEVKIDDKTVVHRFSIDGSSDIDKKFSAEINDTTDVRRFRINGINLDTDCSTTTVEDIIFTKLPGSISRAILRMQIYIQH